MQAQRAQAIKAALRVESDLYAVEQKTISSILADLKRAHAATMQRLAAATKDWDIAQSRAILAEIERQMTLWETAATQTINGALPEAMSLGQMQVLEALAAGGIEVGLLPFISTDFLLVSQQTLPVLIKGISADTVNKVGAILRSTVLAQETPYAAMQAIGDVTGQGVFSSAFYRGEVIVRTEVGRIAQTSNYQTLLRLQNLEGGFAKEWSAVFDGRTRPAHAAANGQVQPVTKPFRVGGEALLYPHDPRASAANTVNCRCASVPLRAEWTGGRNRFGQFASPGAFVP